MPESTVAGVAVRPATEADARGWMLLRTEAFGVPAAGSGPPPIETADSRVWVAGRTGRVLACARDNYFSSWFGGRIVPTSAISSVSVQAEWRGRGILAALLPALLTGAHQRGAVISSLFPTAPAYYRRFGYEVIGSYDWIEIATSRLAVTADAGLTVERAAATDWPDVRVCYERWAARHNGPLTRDPDKRFGLPSAASPDREDDDGGSVTLVRDSSGAATGFAAWRREGGYRAAGALVVDDLCTLDIDAYRKLAATLATHSVVAPTTRMISSGWGDAALGLASAPGAIVESTPYMLAILDVAAALEARGYADQVSERVTFRVRGLPVTGQDGTYELAVQAGRAECRPASDADIELDARGLSLLYSGIPAARARWAGLLRGPARADAVLDRIFGGLPFAIRNYF